MIEIIATVWLISFVSSAILTAWNVKSVGNATNSPRFKILNANLGKVGLFWSLSAESFKPLSEMPPEKDAAKVVRSFLLMGILGFFSLPGFTFLTVISFSMRAITSRTAKMVFASALTRDPDLDAKAVQGLVEDLAGKTIPRNI